VDIRGKNIRQVQRVATAGSQGKQVDRLTWNQKELLNKKIGFIRGIPNPPGLG
jgi:hypothetical protein